MQSFVRSPARRRWLAVRLLAAGVLLTAAGLKLAGTAASPVPRAGWLAAPQVELAVVGWELLLGVWLLTGRAAGAAWLAAVGTFLTFAAVSGYYGLTGVADCGCFGAVKTSPWVAFAVDVTALLLLAFARPAWEPTDLRRSAGAGLRWAGGAAAVLAGLAAVGALWAGSPGAALARLRGVPLSAPGYLDFGTGRPGDGLDATATVVNWSDRSVRLVGGTSDCSCTTTDDLPLTVPPGGEAAVRVRFVVPRAEAGQLTRTVFLWTDHPDQQRVRFRVGCRVE